MVGFEGAKIVTAQELMEFIDEAEPANPTVQGLMFIETRAKEDAPGKLFPCYPFAYKEDERTGKLAFKADIVQYRSSEGFGVVEVILHEEDLGVTKRIWDKPPTKGLRDETPFLEEIVQ